MDTGKIRGLTQAILALGDDELQTLAHEVLPVLLTTRAGLEEIDRALQALSDEELEAVVERARRRAGTLSETTVAAVIGEALRAARSERRS
jgi:hypothetical protein